jgi:myo-inositol 2-dehydrogenase / D-chiro-inositol 1-dehydrogenase
VFCEKPLAADRAACERILDAEVAAGCRFVQVGYMRRYDRAYRMVKGVLDSGRIGPPTLVHSVHRNAQVPAHYTSDMAVNDTAVHDIDVARWLTGEEIVAAQVMRPRRNSRAEAHLVDPLLLLLTTAGGVVVDVEVSVNIGYGYDIRGEVVCESGTVELPRPAVAIVNADGLMGSAVPADWRVRFQAAYDVELQAWLGSVVAGRTSGPSAWDGYAVQAVADACLDSFGSGARAPVMLPDRPELYAEHA